MSGSGESGATADAVEEQESPPAVESGSGLQEDDINGTGGSSPSPSSLGKEEVETGGSGDVEAGQEVRSRSYTQLCV